MLDHLMLIFNYLAEAIKMSYIKYQSGSRTIPQKSAMSLQQLFWTRGADWRAKEERSLPGGPLSVTSTAKRLETSAAANLPPLSTHRAVWGT